MATQQLDQELNQMILEGKAMDAFEKFYAEDVVMQENSEPPTAGKAANRQREIDFFSKLENFENAKVLASAVNGDVSFFEFEADVTFKGGQKVKLAQAGVRRWKNGQIVHERFYYHK